MMIAVVIAGAIAVIALGWWFMGSSSSEAANPSPKSKEEIAKLLEAQGYKVKEVEFDDGVYEAEAYKDGKEFEIKIDRTGRILKIEEDD